MDGILYFAVYKNREYDFYNHPDLKTIKAILNSGAICHKITEVSQSKDYTIIV